MLGLTRSAKSMWKVGEQDVGVVVGLPLLPEDSGIYHLPSTLTAPLDTMAQVTEESCF